MTSHGGGGGRTKRAVPVLQRRTAEAARHGTRSRDNRVAPRDDDDDCSPPGSYERCTRNVRARRQRDRSVLPSPPPPPAAVTTTTTTTVATANGYVSGDSSTPAKSDPSPDRTNTHLTSCKPAGYKRRLKRSPCGPRGVCAGRGHLYS